MTFVFLCLFDYLLCILITYLFHLLHILPCFYLSAIITLELNPFFLFTVVSILLIAFAWCVHLLVNTEAVLPPWWQNGPLLLQFDPHDPSVTLCWSDCHHGQCLFVATWLFRFRYQHCKSFNTATNPGSGIIMLVHKSVDLSNTMYFIFYTWILFKIFFFHCSSQWSQSQMATSQTSSTCMKYSSCSW